LSLQRRIVVLIETLNIVTVEAFVADLQLDSERVHRRRFLDRKTNGFGSWAHNDKWTFQEAALHGSSHYELPGVLRWFTANIGVHHVHHLASGIPYSLLPWVLRDYPELRDVSRLTLIESFRCVRLVLWDEGQQRLVSFHDMRG
jgi:hypothetical protein